MSDEGQSGVAVTLGRQCVPAGAAMLLFSLFLAWQGAESGLILFFAGGAALGVGCFLRAARLLE